MIRLQCWVIFLSFPPFEFFFFTRTDKIVLCNVCRLHTPKHINSVGVHSQLSHNRLPMGVLLVAVGSLRRHVGRLWALITSGRILSSLCIQFVSFCYCRFDICRIHSSAILMDWFRGCRGAGLEFLVDWEDENSCIILIKVNCAFEYLLCVFINLGFIMWAWIWTWWISWAYENGCQLHGMAPTLVITLYSPDLSL